MSENTTPEVVSTDAAPDYSANPLFIAAGALFDQFKVIADSANEIRAGIKSATSDVSDAISEAVKSSDDEKVVAYRAWRDAFVAKLEDAKRTLAERDATISEYVAGVISADTTVSGFDSVDSATEAFLAKRKQANAMRTAILGLFSGDQQMLAAGIEKYGIHEIVSLKGSTSRGATGVRKPRLESATIDGNDQHGADDTKPPTFTTLAATLGVALDVVKDAAAKAAGTDDLMSLPENTPVNFTVGERTVSIVPKHRPEAV